jgi:hypothetical protein
MHLHSLLREKHPLTYLPEKDPRASQLPEVPIGTVKCGVRKGN